MKILEYFTGTQFSTYRSSYDFCNWLFYKIIAMVHMWINKEIMNEWNYYTSCTLTSFPVLDFWNFKCLISVAQSLMSINKSMPTWYLFAEATKSHAKCCQGHYRTSKWTGCNGQSCILLQSKGEFNICLKTWNYLENLRVYVLDQGPPPGMVTYHVCASFVVNFWLHYISYDKGFVLNSSLHR